MIHVEQLLTFRIFHFDIEVSTKETATRATTTIKIFFSSQDSVALEIANAVFFLSFRATHFDPIMNLHNIDRIMVSKTEIRKLTHETQESK
jgi:hypothetical protein